jgi:hypothetical protein
MSTRLKVQADGRGGPHVRKVNPASGGREVYPKPEHRYSNAKIGPTYHDSKPDFPTLEKAPDGAPNVVVVLLDDVGYAWPSTYGGLVRMPTADRLAREGLTYCQFHTTGLCAPTRAALLTGRNHHSVSTGVVQEMATGFPGDAPFQWVKQVASHFGGTRKGMIVSWPAWIADVGSTRFQFHHVIDVMPTILDGVGIAEPAMVDGMTQKPIEGVSMAYTFDRENANATSARTTQYFEMLGNRALYHDGWIASCRHGRLPWVTKGTASFSDDRWELYNIERDFSQSDDLAARHPEKLRDLQDRFLAEAGRRDVLPLDDRFAERMDATLRPSFFGGRNDITLFPGMGRLPEGSAPKTANVDHAISVVAEIPNEGAEGVLICLGDDTAGWSLFVEGDRLRYHYNWFTLERFDVVAAPPLPRGRVELRMELACEAPGTRGGPAVVRLLHGEHMVGQGGRPARASARLLSFGAFGALVGLFGVVFERFEQTKCDQRRPRKHRRQREQLVRRRDADAHGDPEADGRCEPVHLGPSFDDRARADESDPADQRLEDTRLAVDVIAEGELADLQIGAGPHRQQGVGA